MNINSLILASLHVSENMFFPATYLDDFEERAAILQIDGGLSQNESRIQACQEINERYSLDRIRNMQ